MYVSCCTMITIVVLTVVHLDVVIHWVWLWIECMSSMFDTGIWYMIRWSNKTCVVVNTCSSCIIPLLLTWWERIDMLDECCVLSCIVYMFMIWYEFCCYMYFFQYFYHKSWCWSKAGAGQKLVLVKSWCWSKAGAAGKKCDKILGKHI